MIRAKRNSKLLFYLLFGIAEAIVLVQNYCPIFLSTHHWLHIAMTVSFLLCHIGLYRMTREKQACLFLLIYWLLSLLFRIYTIVFLIGPRSIRIRHPVFLFVGNLFCGTYTIYLPGLWNRYAPFLMAAVAGGFAGVYGRRYWGIRRQEGIGERNGSM